MANNHELLCQDCYVKGEFIHHFGNEESKRVCRQCHAATRSKSNNYHPIENPGEEIEFLSTQAPQNTVDLGLPPFYYQDAEGNNCVRFPENYDEYFQAREQLARRLRLSAKYRRA